jgi:transposase InsO family protein
MPWRERTTMSERREFISFARQPDANLSALCRQYGISRKTAYKWLGRARAAGRDSLSDQSRRPQRSPRRTAPALEARLCALRVQNPAWGGRKLYHFLRRQGVAPLPAPSTITGILERNGLLHPDRRPKRDWQRFEAEQPNALWQMDFKDPIALATTTAHALTILDDHSRFNICLALCPDQRRETVQAQLVRAFERYGLPECLLMDNGPPWGSGYSRQPFTRLGAWLIRHGVAVSHGRPYHPQTQGKDERFHLTLKLELLAGRPVWHDAAELQSACERWRDVYNLQRPHEALGQEPPLTRYRPSPRLFASPPLAIEYAPDDVVRRVQDGGVISFRGHNYRVGRAFVGEPVALRAVGDGAWEVYYCHQRISRVDLTVSSGSEV